MVKLYLSRKDIEFTELNVSTNREGLTELLSLGFRSTPVTTIGEEHIVGYDPNRIDSALATVGINESNK